MIMSKRMKIHLERMKCLVFMTAKGVNLIPCGQSRGFAKKPDGLGLHVFILHNNVHADEIIRLKV